MIELSESTDGIVFGVKARPGAKRNAITGEHAGMLRVAVTVAPEKGKANDAIVKLLAEVLGLRKQDLSLVRGMTSTEKAFRAQGISRIELASRLEHLLENTQADSRGSSKTP